MISSYKLLIFIISCICVLNGALCFIPPWLLKECSHLPEPENPEIECKYGYEKNACDKYYCLKGPNESCTEEARIKEHCGAHLRCVCGICDGCRDGKCGKPMCPRKSAGKRVSSKPVWFPDIYQPQQQDENRRLPQRQQSMPPSFYNFKNSVDRLQYYPFNNNYEYLNNDD
ncbi:uncharacterized protein LOC116337807 [Contarinia nasturtii]|uniref:uncharacterized protein LOC116337807 n=1 Tax=Contarinia nasturtii TaxID=265458 RepID=UPI0012D4A73F|nr:uncharacterized protein LOC116337807 [Contarinia nasturtii]